MDYPRYDPASPITPLTPAELDGLDRLLQALPADAAMTLDGADGFLTALLVGPPSLLATLATAEWLPLVWGGDGDAGPAEAAPFASKRQRKATVVLLLRHLRHLGQQLVDTDDAAAAAWEPIFSVAEQGAQEFADASDWCTGFLQAVDLQPAPWHAAWTDAALAPTLLPLLRLGGGVAGAAVVGAPVAEATAAEVDTLSRAVPDAVLTLRDWQRRRTPGA